MWPVSPAPVVSSQTILDGKPPTNKSSTQGRNTGCGCVPAWLPALNFALVFKTPGIYFKKIQLLFTLRWPLALHDIIPVSLSCSARGHLKVNKSWIFLKYMPGVLKTSAKFKAGSQAGTQPQAVFLPWVELLFVGGLPSRIVWLDTTGAGLTGHMTLGCLT